MTTVYSKNGICFLIPPASNYRCNGEVWCYCNTEDLQPGGINYQVCDFTPGGRFETDINRLCPPADTAVIRAA